MMIACYLEAQQGELKNTVNSTCCPAVWYILYVVLLSNLRVTVHGKYSMQGKELICQRNWYHLQNKDIMLLRTEDELVAKLFSLSGWVLTAVMVPQPCSVTLYLRTHHEFSFCWSQGSLMVIRLPQNHGKVSLHHSESVWLCEQEIHCASVCLACFWSDTVQNIPLMCLLSIASKKAFEKTLST